MNKEDMRKVVRERYGGIAKEENSCCGSKGPCCCGADASMAIGNEIGYSVEDMASVPEGANLGLGCGNPVALASLKEGEVVLDLGSGGGFDAFLAAKRVGEEGKVIGVDMTPEMLERARANAKKGKYKNVEFRLGEIENLPVADASVDAVISNCVINLSPEKERVFREAYRVLRPKGRLMVSDIVLLEPLPAFLKATASLLACVGGAALKEHYLNAIKGAGFVDVEVVGESVYSIDSLLDLPEVRGLMKKVRLSREKAEGYAKKVVSMKVKAFRK